MQRFPVRTLSSLAMLGLAVLAITGCGSSDDPPAGATKLAFKLTDAGCDPHDTEVPAGPIAFEVENGGSASVTELEVLDGETILGEVENISEGLSGSFSLTLEKGRYTLRCSGGKEEDGTLTVSGDSSAPVEPGD
jgi:iron uptake system component EfeO